MSRNGLKESSAFNIQEKNVKSYKMCDIISGFTDPVKMEWSELARCLLTLKSIASNDECLDELLEGLNLHCQSILKRFQQVPPTTDVPLDPHKCLSGLLHMLVTVLDRQTTNKAKQCNTNLINITICITFSFLLFRWIIRLLYSATPAETNPRNFSLMLCVVWAKPAWYFQQDHIPSSTQL